jgi:transcriptional regulator with XRE-family HTH domain
VALSSENAALLKRFGANVRRERMRLRLTQEKLAEKVGLNPRTIQKIEAGDLNVLVTTAAGIEKALGCGWGKMMGE